MTVQTAKRVSVVAPCYNEADGIDSFVTAIANVADTLPHFAFEFLFVDDGSEDGTGAVLLERAKRDPRIKILTLSRNFGHQRAITAGLDWAPGDYIIVMDADLQDPPTLIPQIIEALEAGNDLVHTVRSDRAVDTPFKRASAKLFYAVMRRWVLPELPENAGDFKGFNRRVLAALQQYRERVRFLRGAFATLGFQQTAIPYKRGDRAAGRTKYSLWKMLQFARDAIVSNTVIPLRLAFFFGVFLLVALPQAALILLFFYVLGRLPGAGLWALAWLMTFFAGAILATLGFVGEYLKVIVLETKQRPLYIVRDTHGLAPPGIEGL